MNPPEFIPNAATRFSKSVRSLTRVALLGFFGSAFGEEIPIWSQNRFFASGRTTETFLCYPAKQKPCPDEIGGWKMEELILRHRYRPSDRFQNEARRVELVVENRYLVTNRTNVIVFLGDRRIGAFRVDAVGEDRVRIPKRLLKGLVDIRLVVPSANVGYGKPSAGFILSRISLVGIR